MKEIGCNRCTAPPRAVKSNLHRIGSAGTWYDSGRNSALQHVRCAHRLGAGGGTTDDAQPAAATKSDQTRRHRPAAAPTPQIHRLQPRRRPQGNRPVIPRQAKDMRPRDTRLARKQWQNNCAPSSDCVNASTGSATGSRRSPRHAETARDSARAPNELSSVEGHCAAGRNLRHQHSVGGGAAANVAPARHGQSNAGGDRSQPEENRRTATHLEPAGYGQSDPPVHGAVEGRRRRRRSRTRPHPGMESSSALRGTGQATAVVLDRTLNHKARRTREEYSENFSRVENQAPSLPFRARAIHFRQQILRHRLQRTGNLHRLGQHFASLGQLVQLAVGEAQAVQRPRILLIVLSLEQSRSGLEFGNGGGGFFLLQVGPPDRVVRDPRRNLSRFVGVRSVRLRDLDDFLRIRDRLGGASRLGIVTVVTAPAAAKPAASWDWRPESFPRTKPAAPDRSTGPAPSVYMA